MEIEYTDNDLYYIIKSEIQNIIEHAKIPKNVLQALFYTSLNFRKFNIDYNERVRYEIDNIILEIIKQELRRR
jgi:hypothetical protein